MLPVFTRNKNEYSTNFKNTQLLLTFLIFSSALEVLSVKAVDDDLMLEMSKIEKVFRTAPIEILKEFSDSQELDSECQRSLLPLFMIPEKDEQRPEWTLRSKKNFPIYDQL